MSATALLFFLGIVSVSQIGPAAPGRTPCLAVDSSAAMFIATVKRSIRASQDTALRQLEPRVALVTAPATCDRAVAAYNSTWNLTGVDAVSAVYVVAIPAYGYVVSRWSRDAPSMEWYDTAWKHLASIVGL